MNSFFFAPFLRAFAHKKMLVAFSAVFLLAFILGICFVTQPAAYDYHLNLCARYVDRVCYSDTNLFLIFFARLGGSALLALLVAAGCIHPVALILPLFVVCYRGYTLGGCIYILFSVYQMTGAVIVFLVYLPVHLLIDGLLLCGWVLAAERAVCFRFCMGDLPEILRMLLFMIAWTAVICAAEAFLLLVFFHPVGSVL